jgi:dTDP-4-dehydrorhamnose reductase
VPGNSAWNWLRELNRRGYQTIGWDRDQLDITDNRQVESVLTPWDPEIVFNAAAYNQVDVAESEPQAAFLVNALAVRNLALACRQLDARFVHFSTDYVFDGGPAGRMWRATPRIRWAPTASRNWPASFTRRLTWMRR